MSEDNKKEACQKLYKQYTELAKRTQRHIQVRGKNTEPKYVKPEDSALKEKIRLQLLTCKEVLKLSPGEWFKIEKR